MAQREATDKANEVKQQGKQAVRKVARQRWVEPVMRMGFAARGVLYGLVGLLAIQVALGGQGGQFADRQGAIATIAAQPFGRVLLILIAIGLVGYALWGIFRAVLDPLNKGHDAKGLVARGGYLASAASYGALLFPTVRTILQQPGGAQQGTEGSSSQQAVSTIMARPFGQWLVGLAGLAVIGVGIAQIVKGVKADFENILDPYELNASQRRWANRLGRVGYVARGIVFSIVGIFIVQAALTFDPRRVVGLDGALRELASQPFGWLLLVIVAAGLIAFGLYSIIGALWFRLKTTG